MKDKLTALTRRIAVAKGDIPGDLLLKNGRIVNVYSGRIEEKDIITSGGYIAGLGSYNQASEIVDLDGQYVLPGFIDAHIHIESSHLIPSSFGAAALCHGTTAVIADPHEIANVLGESGLDFMFQDAALSPLDIFYMLPSSVPATDKETSGGIIDAAATARLFQSYHSFLGLGEIMNAPGVVNGDKEVLGKIIAAQTKALDGHFPGGSGRELNAYRSAGINSEHEAIALEEAAEKLSLGMTVFVREGSSARNLEALLPLVDDNNWPCFCFCADDVSAADLESHGDILPMVRKAVSLGLPPVRAVQIATINPRRHYGLRDRGALVPGTLCDAVVVEDLRDFKVSAVYKGGRIYVNEYQSREVSLGQVHLPPLSKAVFPQNNGFKYARVIKVLPTEIVTGESIYPVAELSQGDIVKAMVIERHGKSGNWSFGLVEGTGLKRGAIASTIAHDSHNIVAVGVNEKEMIFAAQTLAKLGGGAVVTIDGQVLAALKFPVAGLMSGADAAFVGKEERGFLAAAKKTGTVLPSPLMTLSFLALPVIPKLRLTDKGLFDVDNFDFVPLYFN